MVYFGNKYLTLFERAEIHLTPDETLVFQESSEARYRALDFPKTSLHYVNPLGTDILLECNEGITKQNLLQRLKHKDMSLKAITSFLEESIRRGIIWTEDKPSLKKMRITGSKQYFVPVHFSVELTSQCNLRCIYCYNESDVRKNQRLSTVQLLACLNELFENGIRIIELTGGEPLTHPDFSEILDYCGKHFILLSILTNGTLVDEVMAKEAGKYKDKLMVQVDLDGSTAIVHERLRGVPGCFKKAKKGIEFLARNNILVKVAMNVVPSNVHDIENTLLIAKQCGAYMFSYSPITDVGRAKDLRLSWSPENLRKLEELPKYLYEKYGNFLFQLKEEQIDHFLKRGNCGAGYKSCVLGPTGVVRPCPLLPESYLALGNMLDSSIEEIFGKPLVNYLSKLKEPTPEVCPDCPYQVYCNFCFIKSFYVQERTGSICSWAKSQGLDQWFDSDKLLGEKKNITGCVLPSRDKTLCGGT